MKRALALLMCCAAAGCGQNMETQPKYFEYEPAPLFRDGRVLQAPVAGTVARGDLARAAQAAQKPPLSAELLDRGHEEFDVFCSPCHGRTGQGDGLVVPRQPQVIGQLVQRLQPGRQLGQHREGAERSGHLFFP